jgi:hypothetical protein
MNRRFLSILLVVSALGGQSLRAQAPVAAANADNANVQTPANSDALKRLRARIAEQQEQIKKLQQAVDEQQKMLDQTFANTAATTSATSTADGTSVVETASNSNAAVRLVPAVNTGKQDIVKLPRYMQDEPRSPLSINIGNTTFTPFGFIDAIAYGRSTNAGSGVGSSFGSIPYNNAITGHIGETNISLQNSRLGFRVDSEYKGMKVLGYLEMDFLGNQPTSIYQTSNSDTFRMRNVFVDVDKGKFEFLAGQDWSFATANKKGLSPLPSDIFFSQAVDTNYQAGLIWARQGQFRFIYHPSDNLAMGVSFENPQQFIGGGVTLPAAYATQLANQLNTGSTTYTAPSVFPDIIAKIAADSKIFHIEAAGIVREFKIDTSAGTPVIYSTHSAEGYAGEVNFNVNLASKFRVLANTYFGDGGGRYIGGVAPDLIVRSDGSLAPVHSYSTTDGFEFNPGRKLMLYSYYSGVAVERDRALDANGKTQIGYGFQGSSSSDNKTIQEFTFGIAPTFYKSNAYGALGLNLQYSYVFRDPWYIPVAGPKDAHLNLFYIDLRYTLP